MISIRLLGPVELAVEQRPVAITRRRERGLLAVLALEATRVVPVGRLVHLLWGGEAPPAAHRMVHSHVSRLRQVVSRLAAKGAAVELVSADGGYALQIDPQCVDVHQFRRILDQAAALSGRDRAVTVQSALDLWRGEFLQGLDEAVRVRLGAAIEEQRQSAVEDWAATELALGGHRAVLARLTETAPVRQKQVELHMLALHLGGRTAEAIAVYEAAPEKTPALREAYAAIKRDDVAHLVRPAPRDPIQPPAQLPRAAALFIGRDREADQICEALAEAGSRPVVVAVHGLGGAGKSALALTAAHRAAERFPDGQLYIDLQGGAKVLPPVAAPDALGRLLGTLGVAATKIPVDVDEAAALFRTLLSRRRMLVIADNAASAEQIQPLLPGSAGSALIVTSRPVLATLEDAVHIGLGPLPAADAVRLLDAASGGDRAAVEPSVVAGIAAACGCLPLALRIASARMVARPDWSFSDLARRLAGARSALRDLAGSDEELAGSVRITLQALKDSTAPLDALAARIFVAMGVLDVPDLEPGLAAALAAATPAQAELALDRLVAARLLDAREGRYQPHDLVRQAAAAQAAETAPAVQREILETALRWYISSAAEANRRIRGPVYARHLPEITGTPIAELPDATAAGRWLDAERSNLLAIGRQGLSAHPAARELAGQLMASLYPSMIARGLAYHWEHLCRAVLLAVDRREDPRIVSLAARGLAVLYRIQSRLDEALDQLDVAVPLQARLGDRLFEAGLLEVRGTIHVSRGDQDRAYADLETALAIRRELGDFDALATTLSNLAEAHFTFGRPELSVACLTESLELRRSRGNPAGEATALSNLAAVLAHLGRMDEALEAADLGVERSRQSGERIGECHSRIARAELLFTIDRPDDGLAECDRILRLAEEAGNLSDTGIAQNLVELLKSAGFSEHADHAAERLSRLAHRSVDSMLTR